ncbi:MAG: exodeoxyribonuclease VII large subunit [Candidatus Eisenbacteria bacterium]
MRQSLTVSAATEIIKECIEQGVGPLWVEGEISDFVAHRSGHFYFAVKDAEARLRCVMFRSANQRLRMLPQDGLQCLLFGRVSVYGRSGQYQLIVERLQPLGEGELQAAFLALKERLEREGLFDTARKRKLPAMPGTIGIVTSPTGAAIRDLERVLRRRWPPVRIILRPAIVQGREAAADIVAGIEALSRRDEIDLIIVGRGGGSLEDLWAFNEERVARAIAAARHPVISAVGHEVDVTIADFVADLRAPTPSAAAEMAVPDMRDVLAAARSDLRRCARAVWRRLDDGRLRLEGLSRSRALQSPLDQVQQASQRADELILRIGRATSAACRRARERLAGIAGRVGALNPGAVLERGYAAVFDEGGRLVSRVGDLRVGDGLRVVLQGGSLRCRVEQVDGGRSLLEALGLRGPCTETGDAEKGAG